MEGKTYFKIFCFLFFGVPLAIGFNLAHAINSYEEFMTVYELRNFNHNVYKAAAISEKDRDNVFILRVKEFRDGLF